MTYIANFAASFHFCIWRPKCLQLSYSEEKKKMWITYLTTQEYE